MNKYIWCECPQDYWPQFKTILTKSYNDAVEKIIIKYGEKLDDGSILNNINDWEQLREYLNDKYTIALSDLEDYETL